MEFSLEDFAVCICFIASVDYWLLVSEVFVDLFVGGLCYWLFV